MLDRRPRRTRASVRVLLIDERDQILLFHDSDPGAPDVHWWILPGGGIDAGEDERTTVVREIGEETGLSLDPQLVRGPLARRTVLHGYSDQVTRQDDAFYLARVPTFQISTAGHTELEKVTLLGHRWWSRVELETTDETVWPVVLPELWDLAGSPQLWPVVLPEVEESSVPAGQDIGGDVRATGRK
ncbi:MAG: NUDIX domain-containing protein [Jatrophihabitans sp.]